jgi:hypothetical protein
MYWHSGVPYQSDNSVQSFCIVDETADLSRRGHKVLLVNAINMATASVDFVEAGPAQSGCFSFLMKGSLMEDGEAEEELLTCFEAVGDVFEEGEAEHDALVFRSGHVVAELVGGEPPLRLEAERGGGVGS